MNKKVVVIVLSILMMLVGFFPYSMANNQNESGFFPHTENIHDDFIITHQSTDESIQITLNINDFIQNPCEINAEQYFSIGIGEESQIINEGFPDLPNICRSFIILNDKKMKVNIIDSSYESINNIDIAPSKGHLLRPSSPDDVPYEFDDIYNQDIWYPTNLVELRDPYILRDFRGQTLCFQPFQYNPAQKTLKVFTSISIELRSDGPGEINVLNNEIGQKAPNSFLRIYEDHFYNFGDFQYTPVSEEGNMLIITYDDFYDEMQPFVEWKNQKGIPTEIVNVTDAGNTAANIKDYIETYYNTGGLTFVLLVGDIDQVPSLTSSGYASDPSYGYISGSDSYPEVFIGRFSAQDTDQLDTMITRTLTYEKNPDTSADWYHQGLGIASNEGSGIGDDDEADWEHMRNIRTDLMGYTYTLVDELYDGSQGGEDDPGYPSENDVTISVNDGRSIINYCGHGSPTGWSTTSFSNSDVNNLANDNMLPFVISVACNNGEFDTYSTCFCEAWLRATNDVTGEPTGAIVATGSSKSMSWAPPMDAQDEMNDLLTEQYPDHIMHTIGGIHANGCMHMNDEYGSSGDAETDTWHIFGDPSLVIRTDGPDDMIVDHPSSAVSGSTTFQLNVVNIENALCALSYNGVLLGYNYTDENGVCIIELDDPLVNMDIVDLVVTAFNRNPYITSLDVLPPVRQPAEFESMESVLIRYPFGITYDLIAEMSEDVEIITIVSSESQKNSVESLYQNNGVNTDHTSYLIAPSDSYWTRDYGPWFVFNQTGSNLKVVDFEYNRPRPNDNDIPYQFAVNQSLEYIYMDLVQTGGNYMTDGHGISVSTELVWDENSDKTHDEINQTMNQYLGIHTYHVHPDVNGEYIKHVDCWGKYLSPDTILIREVPSGHSQYDEIEAAVDYFEMQLSCYDTPYNIVRVYTPNDEPYTNSLILNDKILIPQTGSQWDDEAIASYENAMPGYEVLGFTAPTGSPWESTDALHCRTKGIPDRHMLYIDHNPLTYQLPSDDGFYVQAQITPYSGMNLLTSSPKVVWRNSTGIWNDLLMNNVEENIYGAFIPPHACGEIIEYYINAQDASGRNENHPYIGPADPHSFNITFVPDIWIHPDSFSLSNTVDSTVTDILTVGNDEFAGEQLDVSLSCSDNQDFGWLSVNLSSASLQPGEEINILVQANTSDLPVGSYSEFIIINSNDPDEQIIYIPVNLTVVLAHDVGVLSVNFPSGTQPHGSYPINATIKNFGAVDQYDVVVNCTIMEGIIGSFLSENFSGVFPPDGWTQEEPGEWNQYNGNNAGGTSPEARLYWSDVNADYACLTSKPVSTVGAPSLKLKFNHSVDFYSNSFNCRVLSRADNTDSWMDITPWENPVTADITAEEQEIDISSDIGTDTQVRFEFQGNNYYLNYWYVDDVNIFAPDTRESGDIVFTTENQFNIQSLQQKDIIFTPDWQADQNGFYAIDIQTRLTGDQQAGNDAAIGVVEIFEDVNPPVFQDICDYPDPQIMGHNVNISCIVTDETTTNDVRVIVDGPTGFSSINESMLQIDAENYFYDSTYALEGNYSYHLWAIDSSGNSVTSPTYQFRMVDTSYHLCELDLKTGWNLITIPLENEWDASDLAYNISNCNSVSQWDSLNQTYDSYVVGFPESDFVLVDGCGYFVDVAENSIFQMVGVPISQVNVSINVGWNMIGWYHEYDTNASSLAENISGCGLVSRWDGVNQSFDSYVVGFPESDFVINSGMGLFIDTNQSNNWNGSKCFSHPSFPPKIIFGYAKKNNNENVDGASVRVYDNEQKYDEEETIVSSGFWQVDIGPETGVEWADGTEFTVAVSLHSLSGSVSGAVKGTYTDMGTIFLKEMGISDVAGGFLLSAIINSDDSVAWKITVEGNILFGGDAIGIADGTTKIQLPLTIGFGDVDITISAGSVEKQYSARMIGPFILDLKEIKSI